MKMLNNKKGYSIADIPWIAIIFGTGIIVLSIISQIVGSMRPSLCTSDGNYWNTSVGVDGGCQPASGVSGEGGGFSYNSSIKGETGLTKIANWLPTIGLVLGAVIIIGALSILFTMRMRDQ